jgi:hypothetical protein
MSRRLRFSDPGIPASDEQLIQLEKELGFDLPPQYREFLLSNSGGGVDDENAWIVIEKNGKSFRMKFEYFYSVMDPSYPSYELKQQYLDFQNRIPKEMVAIGHDGFGNQILLGVSESQRGKVFFWDHEDEGFDESPDDYHNTILIANSFDEFVERLGPVPDYG